MPFYKFKCVHCEMETEKRLSVSEKDTTEVRCVNCNQVTHRIYVSPPKPTITEIGSKYHGKSMKSGMTDVLKKRSQDDLKDKMGELVEKHGLDTMKRTTLFNDKGKLKNKWDE